MFGMTDMIYLNQAVEWKQFALEQALLRLVIDIFQSAEVSFCIIKDAIRCIYCPCHLITCERIFISF